MAPVRRRFIAGLALAILFAPLEADAQQAKKTPRVGVLMFGSAPTTPDWKQRAPWLQELHRLGWREDRNITIEHRWADRRTDRLAELAAELVRLPVDVLLVGDSLAIRAAQQATTTIPIVMVTVGDPVAEGLVASLARPGRNLTGVGGLVVELGKKRLALLTEAVPGVKRVAVLVQPKLADDAMVSDVQAAAKTLGVQIQIVTAGHPQQFEHAFDTAVRQRADALLVLPGVFLQQHQRQLAALAMKYRLPAMYHQRSFAESGGLMAYGPKLSDLWRRAAVQVDKLLKGAKVSDLPVEQPMKLELVINLKTAQALGITVPQTLLLQADELIQ